MFLDRKGKQKIFLMCAGIVCLFFILLIIILPGARVTITSEKRLFRQMYEVKFDPSISKILLPVPIMPAASTAALLKSETELYQDIPALGLSFKKTDMFNFLMQNILSAQNNQTKIMTDTLTYTIELIPGRKRTAKLYAQVYLAPNIKGVADGLHRALNGPRNRLDGLLNGLHSGVHRCGG